MHLSNPWVRLAVVLISLAVFSVAWWLISPLFIDQSVNEAFPTLAAMPTRTTRVEATPMLETTQSVPGTPQGSILNEAMPTGAGTVLLVTGDFYDIAHHGEGSASVYQGSSGERFLRLEDFYVLNGPDLHVYLTTVDPVPNTEGVELIGYVDLGDLKGNLGDQNYLIPGDIDLDVYRSVVIWCVPFRVPFSGAPLQLP